jgi:hypothetical protein
MLVKIILVMINPNQVPWLGMELLVINFLAVLPDAMGFRWIFMKLFFN